MQRANKKLVQNAPISKKHLWALHPDFEARLEAAVHMPVEVYKELCLTKLGELTDLCNESWHDYCQFRQNAEILHDLKVGVIQQMALEEMATWMRDHAFSAQGESVAAFIEAFKPGAEANKEVQEQLRKDGFWTEIGARKLKLVPAYKTEITSSAARAAKQLFVWSDTLDLQLLDVQTKQRMRRARKAISVAGRTILVATTLPPQQLTKEIRDMAANGFLLQGEVIPQVKPRLHFSSEGEWELKTNDMSGRLIAEQDMLKAMCEEAREKGFLRSTPPFLTMPLAKAIVHAQKIISQLAALSIYTWLKPQPGETPEEEEIWRRQLQTEHLLVHSPRLHQAPMGDTCQHCMSCAWCTTCDCPLHNGAPCQCSGEKAVLKCVWCARAGCQSKADVLAAIRARGQEVAPEEHPQVLLRKLVLLEHLEHAEHLLKDFGYEDESITELRADSDHLLQVLEEEQNTLLLWRWADGSPILSKTFLLHLWGVLFDHKSFHFSVECEQWCFTPRLGLIIPISDSGENLQWVQGFVTRKWRALSSITLQDGTKMRFKYRFLKGDAPIQQKFAGCNTGNAIYRCWLCDQPMRAFVDLNACCMDAQPRDLHALHERAASLMAAIPGCQKSISPRALPANSVRMLLRKLNVAPDKDTKKQLNQAIHAVKGINAKPLILGGCAPEDLPILKELEFAPDFPLHVLKGLLADLRALIKESLPKPERGRWEEAEKSLIAKEVYAGSDYRLWLASSPRMWDAVGATCMQNARLQNLKKATTALAHATKFCFRAEYPSWQRDSPKLVLRAAGYIYLFCVHLLDAVPPEKVKKGGKHRGEVKYENCYQLFFHLASIHAVQFIYITALRLIDCEETEAQFGPLRQVLFDIQKHTQKALLAVISVLENIGGGESHGHGGCAVR